MSPMRSAHRLLAAGGFLLAACIGSSSCTNVSEIASPDEVLALLASPSRLPADGFSVTLLTAEIASTADERFRDIVFSTTMGRFPASAVGGQRTITVTADSGGRAVVELQASQLVGIANVSAEIRDGDAVKVSRSLGVPFDSVPPVEVVARRIEGSRAPADGATATRIVATLSGSVPLDQRTVTFSASMGTFASSSSPQVTRTAGSNTEIVVDLISPRTPGLAVISAALGQLRSQANLQFEPAYPDTAALSFIGSFQVAATFNTKRSLRLELFRHGGEVSPGLEVGWEAFDESTGNEFGFFSAITLVDDNGNATADFTPGNTTERGEAVVSGFVVGTFTNGKVVIELVDPP